jgi:hypothetical protein
VERLAATLCLPREQVITALAASMPDDVSAAGAPPWTTLREDVIGDASLSKAHLREWLALLDERA